MNLFETTTAEPNIGGGSYLSAHYILAPLMLNKFQQHKEFFKIDRINGHLMAEKSIEDILQLIKESGGVKVFNDDDESGFMWDDGVLSLDFNAEKSTVTMAGYYVNSILDDLFKNLKANFVSKSTASHIFTIIKTSSGLAIQDIGNASCELLKDNYHPEVIEDIEYVTESFKKTPPIGRICILSGPPGSGKTHLIRTTLSRLDSIFLIVPPSLIESLAHPDFLTLLLTVHKDHKKDIILVIEDGDACLVPRRGDNISAIASLLNISDGILGSMLNIKVIISTNAEIKQVDEAITRPGRLCKHIYIGALPYEQANRVYHRLMKDDTVHLTTKQKLFTLAEIYSTVNTSQHPKMLLNNSKPIGFVYSSAATDKDLTLNKV